AKGNEAAQGAIGEIEILAEGMRAEAFRPGAETKVAAGWFRTGDLGYLDPQGELHVVGRSKDLIIQGGINVYPQQIVDAIAGLEQVADCAVVGVPDPYLGEAVVACVVRREGTELHAEDVFAHCRAHVDARRLPARVRFFDALPRNALGKIKAQE